MARLVLQCIGAREVHCVIGGSMGGMQALEWAFVDALPVRAPSAGVACGRSKRKFRRCRSD
jgi:homoserine acetyltransferase